MTTFNHKKDFDERNELIGFQVRKKRIEYGWNQTQLAEKVGCNQQSISHLENPTPAHNPTLNLLKAVSDALQMPIVVEPRNFHSTKK